MPYAISRKYITVNLKKIEKVSMNQPLMMGCHYQKKKFSNDRKN